MIRVNKYLADKGIATRREADRLIEKGLVFINDKKANLGDKVTEEDKVEVRGKKKAYKYFAYNKPVGLVTSTPRKGKLSSGEYEKEILDVAKFPTKVFPVGRLDKDSHGLLIFTDDGRITDRLLSPVYYHEKEYMVKVNTEFNDSFLSKLEKGFRIDDYFTKPAKTKRLGKSSFKIILTEGKKRQIRRMCEALDRNVVDLKRVRVMNIKLGDLKEGAFREIKGKELAEFLELLSLD